jgi:dihydroorotase
MDEGGGVHASDLGGRNANPKGEVMSTTLTIRRPDDWHVHLRDGAMLESVARYTARQFARAIVMPNLSPPVTTASAGAAYRDRILAATAGLDFTPLITAYLTDGSDADDLAAGHADGIFTAAKLYPAHATTGSAHGVTDVAHIHGVLERMQVIGMPLLIHGEVTDSHVDIFDREAVFIERTLIPLVRDFPDLRIVFEHITTRQAAEFVASSGPNIAATITPQHLHINRNAMFAGGIRPHMYCLPVAKREEHRLALRAAATSVSAKFFLGTDSAPHTVGAKESACGCAGIFNAPYALESYLAVFEEESALDRFEGFASLNGPAFYRLPVNDATITLVRDGVDVPDTLSAAGADIIPFHAGERLNWRLLA